MNVIAILIAWIQAGSMPMETASTLWPEVPTSMRSIVQELTWEPSLAERLNELTSIAIEYPESEADEMIRNLILEAQP